MNIPVEALSYIWAAGAVLVVCGLAVTIFVIGKPGGAGGPGWRRYLASFEVWIDLLAAPLKPIQIVGYQALTAAALVGAWLYLDFIYFLYPIPAIVPLTYVVFRIAYDRRVIAISLQLDGWLLMLSNMLKATGSVGNAIESSASLVRTPLKEEVELLVKQFGVGMTIEDSLANMYKRVPSVGLRTVVSSLRIGRQLGGDLPSLLAENAATIRESERIDGFIRSQVSQGKAQMIVLALAPAGLIGMFMLTTPGFFEPLLTHVLGSYIIIGCVFLWVIALVLGFKIMNVDA